MKVKWDTKTSQTIHFNSVLKGEGEESFQKFVAQNYCNFGRTFLQNYTPLKLDSVGWAAEYK